MSEIAVITPLYHLGNPYIRECYDSLKRQSLKDWKWYVLLNNGGILPDDILNDNRVKVIRDESLKGVGALKRHLSYLTNEPFIVELDCDDILAKTALACVLKAFNRGADFVYSDCAEFKVDIDNNIHSTWEHYPYSSVFGWTHYEVPFKDTMLMAMRCPPATPQNIRLVDWSPNHVRAWRRSSYEKINGHNPDLTVADDHDLIVRLYLSGAKFQYISKCLYFYRVHANNTVKLQNSDIRAGTWGVYNRNIWELTNRFCCDNQLMMVDLCGGIDKPKGFVSLDKSESADIVCDLDEEWPINNSIVGCLRAYDAIEHLKSPIHIMNEAYRVLAPGGFFMISVPSTDGKGAFCDPTHVSYWNDLSFRYYTNQHFAKYIPDFKGKFQVAKLITWFPSQWHKDNNVPYVEANLIKLGEGYEPYGEVLF